jgi:hypothetical protein
MYPALSRPMPDTGSFRKLPVLVHSGLSGRFSCLCPPTPCTAAHCTPPLLLLQLSSHHSGHHYPLQHLSHLPHPKSQCLSGLCAPSLQHPAGCLPPHSTMLAPSTKWSLCPQDAACTNLLPTSSSLLTTALYNTCPSGPCAHYQTWSQLIAYAYRFTTCRSHHSDPPMPGVVYLPMPTKLSLGDHTIQPFVHLVHVPTITRSQLIAYTYRIVTWGSHYSDVDHQATWSMCPLSPGLS